MIKGGAILETYELRVAVPVKPILGTVEVETRLK